ncbi:MAG: GNAT family N-acetyltransferase [Ferruginibacter sp.]
MAITWKYHAFDELSSSELYAILQLRNAVFVLEQHCVYQDADNKDDQSIHQTGWEGNSLAAYCRILPPGLSFKEASIGRVVTSPVSRGVGYGRELMERAVEFTLSYYNCRRITIGAQHYLENFYESIGFVKISDMYLEDGIPHIEMQLQAK